VSDRKIADGRVVIHFGSPVGSAFGQAEEEDETE
jgi:hypothetical protein